MWGAVLGAAGLTILFELLRFASIWRPAIYGGLIILVLNFRPSGIITRQNLRGVERFFSNLRRIAFGNRAEEREN